MCSFDIIGTISFNHPFHANQIFCLYIYFKLPLKNVEYFDVETPVKVLGIFKGKGRNWSHSGLFCYGTYCKQTLPFVRCVIVIKFNNKVLYGHISLSCFWRVKYQCIFGTTKQMWMNVAKALASLIIFFCTNIDCCSSTGLSSSTV